MLYLDTPADRSRCMYSCEVDTVLLYRQLLLHRRTPLDTQHGISLDARPLSPRTVKRSIVSGSRLFISGRHILLARYFQLRPGQHRRCDNAVCQKANIRLYLLQHQRNFLQPRRHLHLRPIHMRIRHCMWGELHTHRRRKLRHRHQLLSDLVSTVLLAKPSLERDRR